MSSDDQMAAKVLSMKTTLRQEMKQIMSLMSIEEKLLQSNYVADKVYICFIRRQYRWPHSRALNNFIFFQVIQHPKYLVASRIGIYLNLPDEIQTDGILKHMFSIGKLCFIPR